MRPNALAEIKQALFPMIEHSIEELSAAYSISRKDADLLHDQLWMQAHGDRIHDRYEFLQLGYGKSRPYACRLQARVYRRIRGVICLPIRI